VDLQALLRTVAGSAGSSLGPSELSAINGVFKRFRAFGVGIGADAQAIRMSVATLGEGAAPGNGPGSALPLEKAPGASWLAFTQSDIGKSISGVLDSLKNVNSGSGGGTVSDAITQFETATGLKVKEDLLSWMGDAGLFVEGDSLPALTGALVIQSTDPAKTRAAITKIKGLMRQFNQRPGAVPPGTRTASRSTWGAAPRCRSTSASPDRASLSHSAPRRCTTRSIRPRRSGRPRRSRAQRACWAAVPSRASTSTGAR